MGGIILATKKIHKQHKIKNQHKKKTKKKKEAIAMSRSDLMIGFAELLNIRLPLLPCH